MRLLWFKCGGVWFLLGDMTVELLWFVIRIDGYGEECAGKVGKEGGGGHQESGGFGRRHVAAQ